MRAAAVSVLAFVSLLLARDSLAPKQVQAAFIDVRIAPASDSALARYSPDTLNVTVGDTVRWISDDVNDLHNVVIPALNHRSDPFGIGEEDFQTFEQPGTYSYYCEPHPYMKGTVIVTGAAASPTPAPFTPVSGLFAPVIAKNATAVW